LTTDATTSGTAGSMMASISRVWRSTSSRRVPISISPVTRTSPSSLGGRNSLPISGSNSRLAPSNTTAARTVVNRCPRAQRSKFR